MAWWQIALWGFGGGVVGAVIVQVIIIGAWINSDGL